MRALRPADDSAMPARHLPGRRWRVTTVALATLMLMPVAHATTQCPPEHGHKPEWIGWLGMLVLCGGLIAGPVLAGWMFARSKGAPLRWRVLAALAGVVLMLGLWTLCGLLAGHLIMQC